MQRVYQKRIGSELHRHPRHRLSGTCFHADLQCYCYTTDPSDILLLVSERINITPHRAAKGVQHPDRQDDIEQHDDQNERFKEGSHEDSRG